MSHVSEAGCDEFPLLCQYLALPASLAVLFEQGTIIKRLVDRSVLPPTGQIDHQLLLFKKIHFHSTFIHYASTQILTPVACQTMHCVVSIYNVHDLAPEYPAHLLYPQPRNPHRQQFQGHHQLAVSSALKSTGKQAFDVTGPTVWN